MSRPVLLLQHPSDLFTLEHCHLEVVVWKSWFPGCLSHWAPFGSPLWEGGQPSFQEGCVRSLMCHKRVSVLPPFGQTGKECGFALSWQVYRTLYVLVQEHNVELTAIWFSSDASCPGGRYLLSSIIKGRRNKIYGKKFLEWFQFLIFG